MEQRQTAALILAAGTSSRMGQGRHKLLLPLGERPVLAHVLSSALASRAHPVILVLGHQAAEVRSQLAPYLPQEVVIVENPAYREGMSTSLHIGLETLLHRFPQIDSALILLGDQPLLSSQLIDALITTRRTTQKLLVAPLYNGKRGNPVLFAAELFPELLQVTGDEGGRQILERQRGELATLELETALPAYDVDTWEAYQQVVTAWEEQQGIQEKTL